MSAFKIGVRLESLALPLRRALSQAERLGVRGVQIDAVGDVAPERLSETGRREFLHLLRGHNLEVTALGCPLRHGLDVAENQQPRIEHVKKVMTLAYHLGARKVVVQAGRVPEGENDPRDRLMTEALTALGRHGDHVGTTLALDTGLDPGPALAAYLDRFDTGSLAVNFDPANLIVNGFNVFEAVAALRLRIVQCHARDARSASANRVASEVPLGHGSLDWLAFLSALEETGFRGYLIVEREMGNDPLGDVTAGVTFLRRLIGPG